MMTILMSQNTLVMLHTFVLVLLTDGQRGKDTLRIMLVYKVISINNFPGIYLRQLQTFLL